jgi:hypothetical protein
VKGFSQQDSIAIIGRRGTFLQLAAPFSAAFCRFSSLFHELREEDRRGRMPE